MAGSSRRCSTSRQACAAVVRSRWNIRPVVLQSQPQPDMREIHRALPREGDRGRAPRRRPQLVDRDGKGGGDGRFHQPADAGGVVMHWRPSSPAPRFGQGFHKCHRQAPLLGLFA